jgi:4-hydroxy-2-oxoheptanedioate aldolase
MLIASSKEKPALGVMLSEIPFANAPVIFKNCGFRFFVIDAEHGAFDYREIAALLMVSRLYALPAIVRLPDNSRRDITRLMDMGADGLLLPMTNEAQDIAQVVRYAKYSPLGKRGISTMRAHTNYNPGDLCAYQRRANEQTMVLAQIETTQGLLNIHDIVGVDGLSGVLIGPNDLSSDMGSAGQPGTPEVIEAIAAVARAAGEAGKQSGIITSDAAYIRAARQAGMEIFCCGSELSLLRSAGMRVVKQFWEG